MTQLRVENAYFYEGAPKHGLANFLGTEVARYRVLGTGALEEVSIESRVDQRPSDQPAVQLLVTESQRLYRCHRFFYQVLLSKKSNVRSAVLLGSESEDALNQLTERLLSEPETVCRGDSSQCTVFPEACTVSLEIEITVNGVPQTILWGDTLRKFAEEHAGVRLFRRYTGRLNRVEVNVHDGEALRVPLLPGDVIKW